MREPNAIGVEKCNPLSACLASPYISAGGGVAKVRVKHRNRNAGLGYSLNRVVGRTVVDDYDFVRGATLRSDAPQAFHDPGPAVMTGYHDGYAHDLASELWLA